jgi:uncharacterized LabA/DUF88 family protein
MAIRNPSQRVGVFVDVQNLYYSARNIYNSRVNFGEVLKAAVGDRHLMRALAYVVKADMPEEHTFFEALDKAGFEVKSKELQTFYGGNQKGDWDVGITVDIVRMLSKLDVVVLCGGDGDFIPLIEYAQQMGVLVEVCAFGKSTSGKVKELADDFIDLDQNKKYLIPMKTFNFFNKGNPKPHNNQHNGNGQNGNQKK